MFSLDGQTRSKFYSSVRFIQDQVHGVTGSGVGAFMVIPGTGYESSSGGPFFRGTLPILRQRRAACVAEFTRTYPQTSTTRVPRSRRCIST